MKKLLFFSACIGLTVVSSFAQTTATNFTANDCDGNSHTLFTELDAGKVIVIAWVMPCSSCLPPSLSAYNIAESYDTSHPGRVKFYLADDYANTNCTSLANWGNSNGLTNSIKFSNAAVSMGNYGQAGMPKIVVLGGAGHTVYFNQNNGLNTTNFQSAIDSALMSSVGIDENGSPNFQLTVFPNPAINFVSLAYTLTGTTDVSFDIYNTLGERVKSNATEKQIAGKHELQINMESFSKGVYFVKMKLLDSRVEVSLVCLKIISIVYYVFFYTLLPYLDLPHIF